MQMVILVVMALMAVSIAALPPHCTPEIPCRVIVDQDCGATADTNVNAVLTLLLDPAVELLGVTIVYGDGFQPANYAHCYRLLEIFNQTLNVPILWGAEQPTYRTKAEVQLWEAEYNSFPWIGMFNPTATDPLALHAASFTGEYSALREGCTDGLASRTCDCHGDICHVPPAPRSGLSAAEFIVQTLHQEVDKTGGPLVVVGLGPFTNIGLARQLDPSIVTKAHLWAMAGSFNAGELPQHEDIPRHETNLWFDPAASRQMLRADLVGRNWLSVTFVPADVCFAVPWVGSPVFPALAAANATARSAQYIVGCKDPRDKIPLCDELAATLLSHPHLGRSSERYVDVDISAGSGDGNTLSWLNTTPPDHGQPKANVFLELVNVSLFYQQWLDIMLSNSPPPTAWPLCARH